MSITPKPTVRRKSADVIHVSFSHDHAERLVSAFERQSEATCKTQEHLAYAAEKVGEVANGFVGTGKFLVKWGPWALAAIMAMAQVVMPSIKDFVDKLPPLPQ